MKKSIFIISFCLIWICSCAKTKDPHQFFIEFKLCDLVFNNDSNFHVTASAVKILCNHLSEIVPIYKTSSYSYGIQFEVFESKINTTPEYFLRTAYYYKDIGNWILIDESSMPSPVHLYLGVPEVIASSDCNRSNTTGNFEINYIANLYCEEKK